MTSPIPSPPERLALLIETDGPGGAEQVVALLASEFAATGTAVTVFTLRDGEGWLGDRLAGTPVTVVPLPLGGPVDLGAVGALRTELRDRGIELLHTHEFGQSLVGAWAARRTGIPHLITMHGGHYYAERWRRRAILRTAVALSGALTAVSTPLALRLEHDLGLAAGRVLRMPNGAGPARVDPARTEPPTGIPAGVPLLLAVGNLYPVKGHRHLIQALAHLTLTHPRLHLAIAGRGALEGELRRLATDVGVADRVHLLGLRTDVGELLARADLFVHPSLDEGLPLALVEAMLAGRPVIASGVGEIPVVLDGGAAGRLVRPGNALELAGAIDALLRDRPATRELAAAGQRRAQEVYAVDRMVTRYRSLYRRLRLRGAEAPARSHRARSSAPPPSAASVSEG